MPSLTQFKGFLFDVDQTLNNSNREVTPETRAALKKLYDLGYKIGFCTGKHYAKLTQEKLEQILPVDTVHVLTGGSQLVTNQGEVLWEVLLGKKLVQQVWTLAETHQAGCLIKYNGGFYANQQGYERSKISMPELLPDIKPLTPEVVIDCPAVVLFNVSTDLDQNLRALTNVTIKTNLVHGDFMVYDITPLGVTKATGVQKWAEYHGMSSDQIMGFGDSDNDFEFLQAVGWGVAMGNATPEVKAVAHRVIGSTNDNGLATYLESILQGADL